MEWNICGAVQYTCIRQYGLDGRSCEAGAFTRPLFSSTWAVSDTKYTLNTPSSRLMPPEHLKKTATKSTPYPTESAYVEPNSRGV